MFTDADSLSLTKEIQAKDLYKDFWEDREKFDNNDYAKDNSYFDRTNKKVQTLTTRDCKGPQTNMPKNVGSYVLRHIRLRSFAVPCG